MPSFRSRGRSALRQPRRAKRTEQAILSCERSWGCSPTCARRECTRARRRIFAQGRSGRGPGYPIVRELTGNLLRANERDPAKSGAAGERAPMGFDTMRYSESEIRASRSWASRLRAAFRESLLRDKANVLETSQLWREVMSMKRKKNIDIELTHSSRTTARCSWCAIQQFEVIVTGNLFGDILPTKPRCSPGRSACCLRLARCARQRPYDPSTVRRPTLRERASANPLATIFRRRCCFGFLETGKSGGSSIEAAVT